jgi:photosystem II stability/assembly factor-like uncharacterized protein
MARADGAWARTFWTLVVLAAACAAARAGSGVWTTGGPRVMVTGGGPCASDITSVAIAPSTSSTIYSVCDGRVFRSTDSGTHWALANTGLPSVGRVLVDPRTPSTLYATESGWTAARIFKTVDGGGHWSVVYAGPTPVNASTLTIDPRTPSTLYVGSPEGVFRSTDAGTTWTVSSVGLEVREIQALAVDPVTPSTLYAASFTFNHPPYNSFYKSVDSGASWVGGPYGFGTNTAMTALVVDPATPSTLYAVLTGHQYDDEGGIAKSIDSGATWERTDAGLTETGYESVGQLLINPVRPSVLYAATGDGVFKSTDSAKSWTAANSGLDLAYLPDGRWPLALDPARPARLYAGLRAGALFRSTDAAATWTALGTRLSTLAVNAFAVDPGGFVVGGAAAAGAVLAGTPDGVYRSTDSGVTWTAANTGLPEARDIRALAIDPAAPSTLYAGAGYPSGGIFKSIDSGTTWTAASTGLPSVDWIESLAVDPATPSTLYAGGWWVFKSTDSGSTWATKARLDGDLVVSLAIDPATPSTLYAGTDSSGVFKSIDSGDTWLAARTGLPDYAYVPALAIDPASPTTLFAGSWNGLPDSGHLFKSTNGGDTWVAATTDARLAHARSLLFVAAKPGRPPTLYAGTEEGEVLSSTDSGQTWTSLGGGLPAASVDALAVGLSGNETTLYAGSVGAWQLGATVPRDLYTVVPCRVFDSRLGEGRPLGAGSTTSVPVAGRCGVPAGAAAVALNVTVTSPTGQGHLTLHADDTLLPGTSTVNYSPGQTRASNAVVGLGATGALDVFVGQQSGEAHVIVDVSGYFQ